MIEATKKVGRPSELTPELLVKAKKYLPSCKDDIAKKIVTLPSIEGFALWLGIWRSRVYEWEQKNEEFADIVEQVRATQASRLLNNGLAGTYNSRIAKLILSKHDYREGTEVEATVKGGLSLTALSEAAKKAREAEETGNQSEAGQTSPQNGE